jgi:hypothetical protein
VTAFNVLKLFDIRMICINPRDDWKIFVIFVNGVDAHKTLAITLACESDVS